MNAITENSSYLPTIENTAITIPQGFCVTTKQFEQLAHAEQLARLELTKTGELIVMSPTGGTAGRKNSRLIQRLRNWADLDRKGEVFDSSTVFVLTSGARRSPDASWIRLERWKQLTSKQQDGFPPIAPDFVIELVSPSERCTKLCGINDPADFKSARESPFEDKRAPRVKNQRYEDLQAKMLEYIDNEVKLGWLIEPSAKTVEIYRAPGSVDILNNPQTLSGENILSGFNLDLTDIFDN